MIEGTGLFWIGQHIRTPIVVDLDKALFDIDIWCAVFAHGTQFHKVAVGRKLF